MDNEPEAVIDLSDKNRLFKGLLPAENILVLKSISSLIIKSHLQKLSDKSNINI